MVGFLDDCFVDFKIQNKSTQFRKIQMNQNFDLQNHCEWHFNVSTIFGFNVAKYDENLEKSYLSPILKYERNFNPIVMRKDNERVSFKVGDFQLLDIMNFLGGGVTSPDFVLKADKTNETKKFLPFEWFDRRENNKELLTCESFSSLLRNSNPLEEKLERLWKHFQKWFIYKADCGQVNSVQSTTDWSKNYINFQTVRQNQ